MYGPKTKKPLDLILRKYFIFSSLPSFTSLLFGALNSWKWPRLVVGPWKLQCRFSITFNWKLESWFCLDPSRTIFINPSCRLKAHTFLKKSLSWTQMYFCEIEAVYLWPYSLSQKWDRFEMIDLRSQTFERKLVTSFSFTLMSWSGDEIVRFTRERKLLKISIWTWNAIKSFYWGRASFSKM